ncbi:hypothetical protein NVP1042O_93 [Vibrio phage 1.042.O._10N.286.45.B8]|nr:hypothetical protein NVP1042O_93 [Vibrio phage 1.042.O._10N.286.45.B8]
MTIEKVLLQTPLCALDFKANLEALDVPARLIENASGNPSRYVILDNTNLTTEQRVRLTRLHDLMWCRIDVTDIKLIEEL